MATKLIDLFLLLANGYVTEFWLALICTNNTLATY